MHVIKFSSEDCGTCHKMSHYDAKVAEELGAEFVSVMLQDTEAYRKYRKILLKQYPIRRGWAGPHISWSLIRREISPFTGNSRVVCPKAISAPV